MNLSELILLPWEKEHSREFKLHLHGKRQTSDSSWEFLKIAQKILMDKKLSETTYLCVEIINSRRQAKGKLGHVVQIAFVIWHKRDA